MPKGMILPFTTVSTSAEPRRKRFWLGQWETNRFIRPGKSPLAMLEWPEVRGAICAGPAAGAGEKHASCPISRRAVSDHFQIGVGEGHRHGGRSSK